MQISHTWHSICQNNSRSFRITMAFPGFIATASCTLTVFVLLFGHRIAEETPKDPSCPSQDGEDATLLPNPYNCSTFYICDHGRPVLRPCPPGELFNPELRVCDWPDNVNCTEIPTIPVHVNCEDVSEEVRYYANPYDCETYYVCNVSSSPEPFLMFCPKAKFFDSEKKICENPDIAYCRIG